MKNNRKYIKEEPKGRKITVPGIQNDVDTTADSVGRAEFLLKQVKGRLSGLGFDVDDLEKQKTIQQLMAAPFGFTFSLVWPEKNEWGEKGPVTNINGKKIKSRIDTRAKVVNPNKDGGLIIETKEPSLQIYFFDEKELNRTLGGGEGKLPPGKKGENFRRLLEEGVTYKVKINQPILRDTDVEGDKSEVGDEEDVDKEVNNNVDDENNVEILNISKPKLEQLNKELEKLKKVSNRLGSLKLSKFINNDTFLKTFIMNVLNTKTSNIKINGEPISVMIKKLKTNGLLEAPKSRNINQKTELPSGWENMVSTFFERLFVLYSKLHKCCKGTSKTYEEIKKLFNLIFLIIKQGQSNIKDDQKIKKLSKKLVLTVNNFISSLNKQNISFSNKKQNEDILRDNTKLINELFSLLKEEDEEGETNDSYSDVILLKIMNGGLETIDEDEEVVADRKEGKTKSKFETDALIISNIGKFIKNGNLEGVPNKEEKILPGAGNKVIPGLEDKHLMCDIIKLSGEGGTISNDSEIKIKTKDGSDIEGLDELNRTINEVIKSGKMSYDTNFKGEHIVLKYPSKTPLSDRINVVWSQS